MGPDAEEAVGYWGLFWRELVTPHFKEEVVRQMALFGDRVIIQIHSVQKSDRFCSAAGFHLRGSFVCSCPKPQTLTLQPLALNPINPKTPVPP